MDKYRTPKFDEFIPGFKCQTCYGYFTNYEDEWVDLKFTDEFIKNYLGLIKSDAYETEFRVAI